MASVRRANGKFAGVTDTVESAFADPEHCVVGADGRKLAILGMERVKYRRGIGRARWRLGINSSESGGHEDHLKY